MGVAGPQPRAGEPGHLPLVHHQVDRIPLGMASLHHYEGDPERGNHQTGLEGLGLTSHRQGGEDGRLRPVGGHHQGERQQPATKGIHRTLLKQPVPALGHHHRVNHQRTPVALAELVADLLDVGRREQHPGLSGGWPKVGVERFELVVDELQWKWVDRAHPEGVLGGQGDRHAHPVDPAGGKGLEVGLNPGTAPGVGGGDGGRDRD